MNPESISRQAAWPHERGVALLIVVWVLALLIVLVVGFNGDARTDLLLARNHYESASARATADAGVALAIFRVIDPSPDTQWQADGRSHDLAYGTGRIRVSVQDEGGKVDINAAPPELLAGLLRTMGASDSDATGIAQSIVSWREAGAGDAALGSPAGPSLARRRQSTAFRARDELRLVPGVTRDLYDRIAPFITVYSAAPDIDPLTAPAEVLRSLPDVNPQQVESFIAERSRIGPVPGALPSLSGVSGFLAHRALQAATITSEGKTASGTTFTREAVVSIAPDPAAPYTVLVWRQARHDLPAAATNQ